MSAAAEHMERLQAALGRGAETALRLQRLLALPYDEIGRPTAIALGPCRWLLGKHLADAADAAEELGAEIGDVRWTGIVGLLHHASQAVARAESSDARDVAELLAGMRQTARVLRDKPASAEPRVTLQ